MGDKIKELKRLNKKLKSPPRELGGRFLPEGVSEQFEFMFIAERPSKNVPKDWNGKSNYNFDVTKKDKFLQSMMMRCGVGGSYITDIVKERNIPGRPEEKEVKKWLPFLLKEIEILRPKAIINVGEITYKNFKKFIEPEISKKNKGRSGFSLQSAGGKNKCRSGAKI